MQPRVQTGQVWAFNGTQTSHLSLVQPLAQLARQLSMYCNCMQQYRTVSHTDIKRLNVHSVRREFVASALVLFDLHTSVSFSTSSVLQISSNTACNQNNYPSSWSPFLQYELLEKYNFGHLFKICFHEVSQMIFNERPTFSINGGDF